MPVSPSTRHVALPGLTGLRGVGAVWVAVYHAQYGLDLPVADAGYLGVDLFFILSGFVLSHAHSDPIWTWPRYGAFLRTRFARIFPMHWAALALLGAALILYPRVGTEMPGRFGWRELLSSLLLVQNWGWGRPAAWNAPAWSLSTEWLVSIGFPLFLVPASRVHRPWAAALLCALCLAVFAAFLFITRNPTPGVVARAGIVRTACEFAAGCVLYRIHAAGLRLNAVSACAGAALVLCGLLLPSLAMLTVFGFPTLILLAAQSDGIVSAALSSSPAVFFGEISYSIYLLHWPLLQVSNRLRSPLHLDGTTGCLWFLGYFAVVVALSAATYRLIEMPARRLLRPRSTTAPRSGSLVADTA